MESNPELSFGQKAVGVTFNPGGDELVTKVKSLYADIIDLLHEMKTPENSGKNRHISIAITDAETAQMRAVKAITWKD